MLQQSFIGLMPLSQSKMAVIYWAKLVRKACFWPIKSTQVIKKHAMPITEQI